MNFNRIGKVVLPLLLAGGAVLASAPALAQWHHGPRVGITFGFGAPWPGYYYPPAYYPPAYYPPVVVSPPPAPVYIEQPQAQQAAPAQASNDWYYCGESRGYYPYVRECPGGWQRVPAAPAR